jgi:membrane fusion protein (multidrug efflux system)
MSVSFEANSKRRFHRVTVPLIVRLGEVSYKASNWSVGGFQIDDYQGELQPGTECDVTVLLPYSEFSVHLPIRARVARREGSTLGCAFINLTPAQHAALHHLVEAALEGRLGDLGETLGALQMPLTSAEKKLVEDTETSNLQAMRMRLIPKTVLYVGSFTLLLAAILGVMYYLLSTVRVPDGVVLGNLVSVAVNSPGRISQIPVKEGRKVEAGAPLFVVENREIEAALQAAETKVKTVEAERMAAQSLVDQEKTRIRLYSEITPHQIARTESLTRQIEARLRSARNELARRETLVKERIGSQSELDLAQSAVDALNAEQEDSRLQQLIAQINAKAINDGLFFDGKEIQGRLKELEESLAVRDSRLAEARQELAAARLRYQDLTVKAPAAGTVYSILHSVGENVSTATPVVALDAGGAFAAVGNVAADEAVKVKPNLPVKVFIPTMDLRLTGRVVQIGQQAPTSPGKSAAERESASTTVPIKVVLNDAPDNLPPGIRAVLIMRVDPWAILRAF